MKRNGYVMRADRLKQVLQQIDSSLDEKNVGKAKFSLFVTEAGKRGLLSLTKLENGQLEVDVPRPGSEGIATPDVAPSAEASSPTATAAVPATEEQPADRARRSRRGGRGRDREARPPRTENTAPVAASAETAAAPAVEPATRVEAAPAARTEAPAPRPRPTPGADIGATGLRLTRDEAFDLVKRAVASVAKGDAAA